MSTSFRSRRRGIGLLAAMALVMGMLPATMAAAAQATAQGTGLACSEDTGSYPTFPDVSGSAHEHHVRCMLDYGLTQGLQDEASYGPRQEVTRGQMASFVARWIEHYVQEEMGESDFELPVADGGFGDVPPDYDHAESIHKLLEVGVTAGTRASGGDDFAPQQAVTRAQMASFIRRGASYAHDRMARPEHQPPDADADHFPDDDGSVHEDHINALADAEVVVGFEDGTYGPGEPVVRDQMASYVMRTYDYALEVGLGDEIGADPTYITGVTSVDDTTVPALTPLDDAIAQLPETTTITVSQGGPLEVDLEWELVELVEPARGEQRMVEQSWLPWAYGDHEFVGIFELPEGVQQPQQDPVAQRVDATVVLGPRDPVDWTFSGYDDGDYPEQLERGFDQPGSYESDTIDVDGVERTYHYYVPTSYDGSEPVPLLFDFHGGGSYGIAQALVTDFHRIAEEEGFIPVWSDGLDNRHGADDVPYISALIDKKQDEYNIDHRRVYATGLSNGSAMAMHLAFDLSDRFAAIGIVSSASTNSVFNERMEAGDDISGPMPLLLSVGTQDNPYYPSNDAIYDILGYFRELNQTSPDADVTEWPSTEDDPTSITRSLWSEGVHGSEVLYDRIEEGGHTWAGAYHYAAYHLIGHVSHHVDQSEELWDFFERHQLPETDPVDGVIEEVDPVDPIEVPDGTTLEDAISELAETTTIQVSDREDPVTVDLDWELRPEVVPAWGDNPVEQEWFPSARGDYELLGTFELPEGVSQSDPPTPLEVVATATIEGPDLLSINDEDYFDQPGTYDDRTLVFDENDTERTFQYYVPSSDDGEEPLPVMVTLHGGGSYGEGHMFYSEFDRVAEEQDFIAVTPDYGSSAKGVFPDDIAEFTAEIIDDLAEDYAIDEDRVYASGISMGGLASVALALEASDRIAAIAPVASHIDGLVDAELDRPITVVSIHGTEDLAPPEGFHAAIENVAEQNGADTTPEVEELHEPTEDDPTGVARYSHTGGERGTEAVYYEIEEGGHTWPGTYQYASLITVGLTSQHFHASDVIWEHLSEQSLPTEDDAARR